jgi:translation initiation factor IF-2
MTQLKLQEGAMGVIDTVIVFRILKMLTRKWEEMDAFKFGLIDGNGKRIKGVKPKTSEQKNFNTVPKASLFVFESEMLELKANPNRDAFGTVIEASLDKGKGYLSTIMVQKGTLKIGDYVLAGSFSGKRICLERLSSALAISPGD